MANKELGEFVAATLRHLRDDVLAKDRPVNRLMPTGQSLDAAVRLAHELAQFPQRCLRSDRLTLELAA